MKLFSKNKKTTNVYSNYLRSEDASKKKSMNKLFNEANHSSIAASRCAINREAQSAALKK